MIIARSKAGVIALSWVNRDNLVGTKQIQRRGRTKYKQSRVANPLARLQAHYDERALKSSSDLLVKPDL